MTIQLQPSHLPDVGYFLSCLQRNHSYSVKKRVAHRIFLSQSLLHKTAEKGEIFLNLKGFKSFYATGNFRGKQHLGGRKRFWIIRKELNLVSGTELLNVPKTQGGRKSFAEGNLGNDRVIPNTLGMNTVNKKN